jgi:mono/diheme cytochrome c family protein
MSRRLTALAVALFLWGGLWLFLCSATAAQVERGGPAGTPTPISATPIPGATPTIDRLAAPPTVPSPNQADEGAQLFWLHCQPCHGDRGQGLTDEWRAQYPPEDQYCWDSGCHGERPYDQAFALPTIVPAIIGDVSGAGNAGSVPVLQKFDTLDALYRYVSASMPYFFPGDLTQEEYLAIIAHIARANGVWDGATLAPDTLARYRLRPESAANAGDASGHLVQAATPAATVPTPVASRIDRVAWSLLGLGALAALAVIGGFILWRNRVR